MHNFGGEVDPAPDLRACQDACWYNSSCDGVDWNHGHSVGQQCYLNGPWTTLRNFSRQGITLYILNRKDCGKSEYHTIRYECVWHVLNSL